MKHRLSTNAATVLLLVIFLRMVINTAETGSPLGDTPTDPARSSGVVLYMLAPADPTETSGHEGGGSGWGVPALDEGSGR